MNDEPLAKGRLVPIETLKKYLAGQPEHRHVMTVNKETGEVLEVAQTGKEPPTVVVQDAPEEE